MIQSVNLPSSTHTIISSAHCNPLQPAATNPNAHPVYTLQQPLHLQCTLQPCTAMYSYLQPTFSAHCSHLQPSTLQLFHSVHTAAILFSAHCSYTIQCTLQLYYPVYTAAILSSAHCSYTIYTVHPVHL